MGKGSGRTQHEAHFSEVGQKTSCAETFFKADQANKHLPELRAYDQYGMRINSVEFHPAYHDLMDLAISHKLHNSAWHN